MSLATNFCFQSSNLPSSVKSPSPKEDSLFAYCFLIKFFAKSLCPVLALILYRASLNSLPALSSSVLIHPSFLLILHSSLVALIYKVTGISSIPVIFKYAHFPGTPLWSPSLHPNFFLRAAQNQMVKTRIISPRILDLICIYSSLLRESLLSPTSGQKIESPSLPFPP